MDLKKYGFYTRDIGFESEEQLKNVIDDVIRDIALKTSIFKYDFGFEIVSDERVYDFAELQKLDEDNRVPSNISYIDANGNLVTKDKGIYNNIYVDTIEIFEDVEIPESNDLDKTIDLHHSILKSYSRFNMFDYLNDSRYMFTGDIAEWSGSNFICINRVIPDLRNIDEQTEIIIKPTIIEGIKYYADTTLNNPNVNPTINSYKKYQNALKQLQNKYPVYERKIDFTRIGRWL